MHATVLTIFPFADLLEAGLLLYQRHVAFYLDSNRAAQDGSGRPDVGLGLAVSLKARRDPAAMLSVSQYNLPTLREDLAEEVFRLADKLNGLHFVCSTFPPLCPSKANPADLEHFRTQTRKNVGSSHAQREAFVGIVTRRLQELLLLNDETA